MYKMKYLYAYCLRISGIFGPKGPLSSKGFADNVERVKNYFKQKLNPIKGRNSRKLNSNVLSMMKFIKNYSNFSNMTFRKDQYEIASRC